MQIKNSLSSRFFVQAKTGYEFFCALLKNCQSEEKCGVPVNNDSDKGGRKCGKSLTFINNKNKKYIIDTWNLNHIFFTVKINICLYFREEC